MPLPLAAIAAPAILGGLGKIFGGIGARKDATASLENRLKADLFRQQQFSPFAPFSTLGKGMLLAAFARSQGLEKIFGNKYLDFISNAGNVPGTAGIGGAANLPFPKFKGPSKFGAAGSIITGLGQAFSGIGFDSGGVDSDFTGGPPGNVGG